MKDAQRGTVNTPQRTGI